MKMCAFPHQYIDRGTTQIITEKPIADRAVQFLYNGLRESSPAMFRALTSGRMSSLLGFFQYDIPGRPKYKGREIFKRYNVDWQECIEPVSHYTSARKFFERQIRYWESRPMSEDDSVVVSPADSRILIGSFESTSSLFIKSTFFDLDELLGQKAEWARRFRAGDFAVFRLTPDKYHYNHFPVSGTVVDIYNVDGDYHSCNPVAHIAMASLYSKNRRVVTIIDTDVDGGSGVGLVAMVEIVALMIGDIVQRYSEHKYLFPKDVKIGMRIQKGCPKSLFRPGSSTDVLIFEKDRIRFSSDIVENSKRQDVQSRFTSGFGRALVETDIMVRSSIGMRQMG